ncbi:MAG: Bacillithiol biosynthesis BshC, partial [Gemmatimonadales bacterium]|nr:Bacillithiol biosynthesis BshC [Gemmatimonadales bacterium]
DIMHELATARGSLYPLGKPQERALNFVPLLARYGATLRQEMLGEAREHARRLTGGRQEASRPREETVSARGRS